MGREMLNIIRKIRDQKKLSQLMVAKKLGISRTSYIAIEQGKRDLTLTEARRLAGILGIDLEGMESGMASNYEKYKEMILAYLRNTNADGKLPKTKLAKLVYLADFAWFYKYLQSMSGMQYRKYEFGPVPDAYFRAIDELQEEGKINVEPNDDAFLISESRGSQQQPLQTLSREESAFIREIAKKWEGKRTNEIVDFTHNQIPYKLCGKDEIIPYELITQEDPGHVY